MCLVDDDVAVGPAPVGGGAFGCRTAGGLLSEIVGQILRIHNAADAHVLDRALGVLDVALALLLLFSLLSRVDHVEVPEKLGRFVEKRDV